jgi:hypothetical protein
MRNSTTKNLHSTQNRGERQRGEHLHTYTLEKEAAS